MEVRKALGATCLCCMCQPFAFHGCLDPLAESRRPLKVLLLVSKVRPIQVHHDVPRVILLCLLLCGPKCIRHGVGVETSLEGAGSAIVGVQWRDHVSDWVFWIQLWLCSVLGVGDCLVFDLDSVVHILQLE